MVSFDVLNLDIVRSIEMARRETKRNTEDVEQEERDYRRFSSSRRQNDTNTHAPILKTAERSKSSIVKAVKFSSEEKMNEK